MPAKLVSSGRREAAKPESILPGGGYGFRVRVLRSAPPSLGLSPAMMQEVLKTIRELNRAGVTCVLVEQNVAASLRLADRAYVLENGRITLEGTGAELLADDRVRQAYLGI